MSINEASSLVVDIIALEIDLSEPTEKDMAEKLAFQKLEDELTALEKNESASKIKKILKDREMMVAAIRLTIKKVTLLGKDGKPIKGQKLSEEAFKTLVTAMVIDESDDDNDYMKDMTQYSYDLKCVIDHDGKRYACKIIATHVLQYGEYEYIECLKRLSREQEKFVKYVQLELLECL